MSICDSEYVNGVDSYFSMNAVVAAGILHQGRQESHGQWFYQDYVHKYFPILLVFAMLQRHGPVACKA